MRNITRRYSIRLHQLNISGHTVSSSELLFLMKLRFVMIRTNIIINYFVASKTAHMYNYIKKFSIMNGWAIEYRIICILIYIKSN